MKKREEQDKEDMRVEKKKRMIFLLIFISSIFEIISIAGYMYNIYKTKTFFRYLLRSLCHQENPLVQVNHPLPEKSKKLPTRG